MENLTRAHKQLFARAPDEFAPDLQTLWDQCRRQKEQSQDRWQLPQTIKPSARSAALRLELGSDSAFEMNDWSFSQLCRLAGVSRDTINRLSAETAAQAFLETLPVGKKPTQVLTEGGTVRSIHGTNYTRLWNADLLAMLREFAVDFQRLADTLADRLVDTWNAIRNGTMSAAAIRQRAIPFSVDEQLDRHFAGHQQLIAGATA